MSRCVLACARIGSLFQYCLGVVGHLWWWTADWSSLYTNWVVGSWICGPINCQFRV